MNTPDLPFPPLALALGRLRQPRPAPRAWPFAPRPADEPDRTAEPAHAPATDSPAHDFLRMLPEPALTGALPPERLAPPPAAGVPGPEAARTYWFDL